MPTEEMKKGRELAKSPIKARSTAQLPVYRDASNLMFVLTQVVVAAPRKAMRFVDKCLCDAGDVCKGIALANLSRGEERVYYMLLAEASLCALQTYITILHTLGATSKEQDARIKRLAKSTSAQLVGWRESVKREGHNTGV